MQPDELPDDLFQKFRAMIYRATGIRVPETKRVMIANRLRRRLRATGIGSFAEYHRRLSSAGAGEERARFVDAVTTRETYFFRDAHHYDWIADELVPERIECASRAGARPRLSIWSAACSTGEEVYSILIRLLERREAPAGPKVEVLGTDISTAALEAARAGSYGSRSMRAVDPERRRRFFDRDEAADRWVVRPELRRRARFRAHNLLEPMEGGPFDCILLKNVLIYFDADSKRAATRLVVDALSPGGYLIVGPTEGHLSPPMGLTKLRGWLYRRPVEE